MSLAFVWAVAVTRVSRVSAGRPYSALAAFIFSRIYDTLALELLVVFAGWISSWMFSWTFSEYYSSKSFLTIPTKLSWVIIKRKLSIAPITYTLSPAFSFPYTLNEVDGPPLTIVLSPFIVA